MTVNDEVRVSNHTGDDVGTEFAYAFRIIEEQHLDVFLDGAEQTTGFSVTGIGDNAGGTVIFDTAPGTGVEISLVRDVPNTQEIDYRAFDSFPAQTNEDGLDLLTMQIQQVGAGSQDSLKVPAGDPLSGGSGLIYPNVADRANKFAAFDGAGQATVAESTATPAELGDILDVILTALQTGDLILFDGSNWVNAAHVLGQLIDVILTNPQVGDALEYDGNDWINVAPIAAAVRGYDIAVTFGFDELGVTEDLKILLSRRLLAPRGFTITDDLGDIEVAPTGANLLMDVKVNTVSIYDVVPVFSDGTGAFTSGVITGGSFAVAAGDLVDISITQVGPNEPGEGLSFSLVGVQS